MKKIKNIIPLMLILIIAVFSVYAASVVESDSTMMSEEQINSVDGCYDSDGGVYPYKAGYCVDYTGIKQYDAGLSASGGGLYSVGVYASETFCLTTEMRTYCKQSQPAWYCDNLPDNCYGASLLPLSSNLAYTYFPFKQEYLCLPGFGFKDGACVTPKCGDGILYGGEQCDGYLFGGKTCASLTGGKFSSGTLSCNSLCKIDTSKCSVGVITVN